MLEDDLLRLVGLIYDAAADPARWHDVLKTTATLGGFSAGTIHFQDLQSHAVGLVYSLNVGPDYEATYGQYYASVNPWSRRTDLLVKGRINVRRMVMSDPAMAATEFWNDWARHMGLFDFTAGVLAQSGTLTGAITMYRGPNAERCGETEVQLMQVLTPHIIRATELHRRLGTLETRNQALASAIDQLPYGFVLVDATARIQLLNRAAEIVLAQRDGLGVVAGRLVATDPVCQGRLARIVRDAAAKGGLADAGGTLAVERPSMRRAYVVVAAPLRPGGFSDVENALAAVFISDPEAQVESAADLLVRVYGLTRAEAALAQRLMQGQSLAAAADELGVSRNTVKTHLQRIFTKTGTHRQSELIRLLLAAAPMRKPPCDT